MPSKSKIYTKTGDRGSTRLVDGSCVEKFNPRVEAYGTVDELNSQLGECRHRLALDPGVAGLASALEAIQRHLFQLGSLLACQDDATWSRLAPIGDADITFLESQIDGMDATLPELRNFILPAGHPAATALHVARTICRRSERRTAELAADDPRLSQALIYLNRLSDLLFVAARWVNARTGTAETVWTSP